MFDSVDPSPIISRKICIYNVYKYRPIKNMGEISMFVGPELSARVPRDQRTEPKASGLADFVEEVISGMPGRAVTDSQASAWKGAIELEGSGFEFDSGIVIDGCPAFYCYLVQTGAFGRIWCTTGSAVGGQIVGAREFSSIAIGTPVIVARSKMYPTVAVILTVFNKPYTSLVAMAPDHVWIFNTQRLLSMARYYHNRQTNIYMGLASPRGRAIHQNEAEDVSFGRPKDVSMIGSYGLFTETGLGIYLDSFQTFMRVDEYSGLFGFYFDSLIRLAARNWQFFSMLQHEYQYFDEGELFHYTCRYVYPHETLGLRSYNQITSSIDFVPSPGVTEATVPGGQTSTTWNQSQVNNLFGLSYLDAISADQIGMPRWHEWWGYLGQGYLKILSAPWQTTTSSHLVTTIQHFDRKLMHSMFGHPNFTGGTAFYPGGRVLYNGSFTTTESRLPVFTRGGTLYQPGTFQEATTLHGMHVIESATGIFLIKRPNIITPNWMNRPESPAGDHAGKGYIYSGRGVTPYNLGTAFNSTAPPSGNHVVQGSILYPSNKIKYYGWLCPEIISYLLNWQILHPFYYHNFDWSVAEESTTGIKSQEKPNYTTLQTQFLLQPASAKAIDIDHRYGYVRFYQNTAGIGLFEDGSVVIFDGWGSSITLANGHIYLSCAGDVHVNNGRDIVLWAGHDLILKAHDTIDAMTMEGDIFVRSDEKIHMVAGVSGSGGFLFESQAVCPMYDFSLPGEQAITSGFIFLAPNSYFISKTAEVNFYVTDYDEKDSKFSVAARNIIFDYNQKYENVYGENGLSITYFSETGHFNEFTGNYDIHYKPRIALHADNIYRKGQIIRSQNAISMIDNRISDVQSWFGNYYYEIPLYPEEAEDAEFTTRPIYQLSSLDYRFYEPMWARIIYQNLEHTNFARWNETEFESSVTGTKGYHYPGNVDIIGSYIRYGPFLMDYVSGNSIDRISPLYKSAIITPSMVYDLKVKDYYLVMKEHKDYE